MKSIRYFIVLCFLLYLPAIVYGQENNDVNTTESVFPKNWVSYEISLSFPTHHIMDISPRSFGFNLERMLNPHTSFGLKTYTNYASAFSYLLDFPYFFGLDTYFRFYPWSGTFFLGTSLGFVYINNSYGSVITFESGWRIDFGKPEGFFIQPIFKMPNSIFTNRSTTGYYFQSGYVIYTGFVASIGLGYSF